MKHPPTNSQAPAACPRCHGSFTCRADAILGCPCGAITLTDAQRDYMRLHYQGCLCPDCLVALQKELRSDLI